MSTKTIKVPDIGADSAEVIELLVNVGDEIEVDQSIAVLESDKASLEIPSPDAGKVVSVSIAVGDQLSEGDDVIELATESGGDSSDSNDSNEKENGAVEPADAGSAGDNTSEDELPVLENVVPVEAQADSAPPSQTVETEAASAQTYQVPDVGSDAAEVIELLVAVGDDVREGDSVCVVETDKASVDVPAPVSGQIDQLFISVGDKIGQGQDFVKISSAAEASAAPAAEAQPEPPVEENVTAEPVAEKSESPAPGASVQAASASLAAAPTAAATSAVMKPAVEAKSSAASPGGQSAGDVYAGPATRKQARELGVNLNEVRGTGSRGRILIDDVNQYVKQKLQSGGASLASGGTTGIPSIPAVDWAKFGDVDVEPMTRIHKATAANMVRNWLNVPHVTHFDEADVTELEKYRAYLKAEAISRNIKMTPLAFLLKASAVALAENPKVNSSVHQNGEDIVYRKYVHIGIAVDTPAGLMVPVIRDVDKKDIWELAADVITMAKKAKESKLGVNDMQGGSFTISSLGAMGGTGFTPIVSAPQVAILGVSKTAMSPVWNGTEFVPRQMMPLSLSYDHRAVNGADAGKFMTTMVAVLEDLDRIWNG